MSQRLALAGEAQVQDFLLQMEQQQSASREIRLICGPLDVAKTTAKDAVLRLKGEQTAFWSKDTYLIDAAQAALNLAHSGIGTQVYALIATYWDRNFRVHDAAFMAVSAEALPILRKEHIPLYSQLIDKALPFFLPKGAMAKPEDFPLVVLPETDAGPFAVVSASEYLPKTYYTPFVWSSGQPLPDQARRRTEDMRAGLLIAEM